MKQVLLKISGKQNTEGQPDTEPIEFITEGRLYKRDGATFLEYDETELSGMEGCTTLLEIRENRVMMTRTGSSVPLETIMEFETGKRVKGHYETDVGTIDMELLTYAIRCALPNVSIDYHVSLKGLGEIRNLLEITILEEKDENGTQALN